MMRATILTVMGVFSASTALADIGTVGNPYAPKAAAKEASPAAAAPQAQSTENQAMAAAPAQEEKKPLIEIAFDRNYVSYTGALNQGVRAAEKAKPGGVIYSVVSYLPEASRSDLQNKRMYERAEANVRAVVSALREQGVPASRVNVMMKRGTVEYDTVKVFVE